MTAVFAIKDEFFVGWTVAVDFSWMPPCGGWYRNGGQ